MTAPLRRRAARAGIATATLGLVVALSGCDTSPGAAAIVGGHRISVASLQASVDHALADPTAAQQLGADRAGFVRKELSRLITNVLVERTAAKLHVTVSNADVDAELSSLVQQAGGQAQLAQQAAASGVPAGEIRGFLHYFVLQQKISQLLVSRVTVTQAQLQAAYQKQIDQFDQVDSAHILVTTKAEADRILSQVRAHPSTFGALAAKYSIDTGSKQAGGELGFQPHSQFVPEFADAIFKAKPGTFIEVHSQFGWHVVHVIAHRTTTLAQATPQLRSAILGPLQTSLVQKALTAESTIIGVHVNPRYGDWDATTTEVVAPSDHNSVSSPAPTT